MVRIKTILDLFAYGTSLLGYIPLFPYLDNVSRLLYPVAFVTGIVTDRRGRLIPARFATIVSVLVFLYYASRFSPTNAVVPTVNLLVVLLAIRLASEKSGRNYLQIFALSLFCLSASSLFNLGPVFLAYLCIMLLTVAVSLVVLTFHTEGNVIALSRWKMKRVLAVSALMPLSAVPFMLLFFIILPRTQLPLWNILNQGGKKATGFSDTVTPGGSATVEEQRNVVFRAVCNRLSPNRLYWRGIVLNSFDGKSWSRKQVPVRESSVAGLGEMTWQTIYPEPSRSAYLPALNMPARLSGVRHTAYDDHVYTRLGIPARRDRYEAMSVLDASLKVAGGIERGFYLQVPERISPRLRGLADKIMAKGRSDRDRLAELERLFRAQRLQYATTGLPVGEDPLAQFLFDKKRGHCEFFASAAALLLRLSGVPSRVVGGYYGGNYNELAGYYVVTEDMAHAWVEAYIEGQGWVTVDPSSWAVNFTGASWRGEGGRFRRIRMYLDALGFAWNRAVVTYDLEKQFQLVSMADTRIRQLSLPRKALLPFAGAVLAVMAAAAAVPLLRRRGRSREERVLGMFFQRLQRSYPELGPPGSRGLYDIAREIGDPAVSEFVRIYCGAVYRDRLLDEIEYDRLKELLREMKEKEGRTAGEG